jgi:hypothetical protein
MQLALQDIGQLTDIGFPGVDVGFSAGVRHQRRARGLVVRREQITSPVRHKIPHRAGGGSL